MFKVGKKEEESEQWKRQGQTLTVPLEDGLYDCSAIPAFPKMHLQMSRNFPTYSWQL